jgi:hypothetical protein
MAFKEDPDYNSVAERIVEFREKYPEGTLRPLDKDKPYTIEQINGNTVFIVVAVALRRPDDPEPGVGMAYEPVPGTTPFTRGSELQNAETAAWGRAMIAALAVDAKKGIASREEVDAQNYRAGNQQNPQNQNVSRETVKTQEMDLTPWQSWFDEAEARKADYQGLLDLHTDAVAKNCPPQVLAHIRKLGEAVSPKGKS